MDALSMLGLPMPGKALKERIGLTDEERDALRAKMPKKWQERQGR
jgi:hypothetical protein